VQPSTLPELIQASAKQQQQNLAEKISDAEQKLITVAYDKAATYTTVIIFGGYAGFFALWQLTKDYLSKPQALWSALLILVSIVSFISFEVIKMVLITRSTLTRARALKSPEVRSDPNKLLQALQDLEAIQSSRTGGFMAFWAFTVAVCVIGALGGAGTLAYAFITGLQK
jgi:hypothetical protein